MYQSFEITRFLFALSRYKNHVQFQNYLRKSNDRRSFERWHHDRQAGVVIAILYRPDQTAGAAVRVHVPVIAGREPRIDAIDFHILADEIGYFYVITAIGANGIQGTTFEWRCANDAY